MKLEIHSLETIILVLLLVVGALFTSPTFNGLQHKVVDKIAFLSK